MKSFQVWTPRTRRLEYDALLQDVGCQSVSGFAVFASLGFERICIFSHDPLSATFNQADQVAYAWGPIATGNPPPWPARWAAWVSSSGIRVGKVSFVGTPFPNTGTVSSLFPTSTPSKLSLGFTPEGQMGIAIQESNSTIRVKWFKDSDGTFGDETFTGASPVLFGNAEVFRSIDADDADLVLYYLRPSTPRAIYARFQRENFLIEHAVNFNLPTDLTKLISSQGVDGRQVLYARDNLNRDVTLTSPYYAPSFQDDAQLSVKVESGSYQASAILATINEDDADFSISFDSGAYGAVIVQPLAPLSGDKETLTISIESGSYA